MQYKYNLSEIVNYETDIIHELAKGKNIPTPTQSQKEVKNAIEIIRKGKAADIFNIAIDISYMEVKNFSILFIG